MNIKRVSLYMLSVSLFVAPCAAQQVHVTAGQYPTGSQKWLPLSVLVANDLSLLQTKTKRAPLPKSSNVKQQGIVLGGRVFAITKGGDLKPGRLAKVYLLWNEPILTSGGVPTEQTAPGLVFLSKRLEQLQAANAAMANDPKDISSEAYEHLVCRRELIGIDTALLNTLESTKNSLQLGLIYLIDADEEGNFQSPKIKPGNYLALARGRAGPNDVYWQQEVSILDKEPPSLKLASVQKSCLDLE